MDLLARDGELTREDEEELAALSKEELMALVIATNKSWYQLLERLEDAHRQDLAALESELRENFNKALSGIRQNEKPLLRSLDQELASLAEKLASGRKSSNENASTLAKLESALARLSSDTKAKR